MTTRQLPQDVISLVHHVHLNQEGWWRKGVSQVLTGLLWKSNKPLSIEAIKGALFQQLNVSMGAQELSDCLDSLKVNGTVSEVLPGEFKLSEQSHREFTRTSAEGEEEFNRAKGYFFREIENTCGSVLSAQEVWDAFLSELTAAVKQAGANTFNLLVGDSLNSKEDWLVGFVKKFGDEHISCLRSVVAKFFSAENPEGKHYVLRLMTAYFFVEATQLSKRTIEGIDARRSKRKLNLFLDTNFIFSVLELHDNPANDAAISLISLAHAARPYIDIKFWVLPNTLDEAQRTISAMLSAAKQVQVSRALQSAALGAPIPGALSKFFDASKNAKSPLSADDFFGPYAKNLKTILERKGIVVANDVDISKYKKDQRVIDDVIPRFNREAGRVKGKPRTYEGIEHDVILWYAVNDQRPKHVDSPFDADSWVVTVDNWLAAFDKQKTPSQLGVPTALLPSNLTQLLQFWVPRSDQLETTILDSLKLPLFFRQFDREDERVTMRILGALSRYRDVDDLGVDAVREILVSDALRQRIASNDEPSDDDVLELVESELIEKQKLLDETLSHTKEELAKVQSAALVLAEKHSDAEDSRKSEERARVAAEEQIRIATAERNRALSEAALEAKSRTETVKELEATKRQIAEYSLKELKKTFVLRYFLGVPVVALAMCININFWIPTAPFAFLTETWPIAGYAIGCLVLFGLSGRHAVRFLELQPTLSDWWVARHVKRLTLGTFAFFGTGVFPGYVGDLLKKLVGLS